MVRYAMGKLAWEKKHTQSEKEPIWEQSNNNHNFKSSQTDKYAQIRPIDGGEQEIVYAAHSL